MKLNVDILTKKVKEVIFNKFRETENIFQLSNASMMGTMYELQQFLPIYFLNGDIIFGEILIILFIRNELWFVLKKYSSETCMHFGCFELHELNSYICIRHDKLIDWYPLNLYSMRILERQINLISLKHYVCNPEE